MKKQQIIKKSNDFSKIINNGKNIKNKYYSIYYIKNENNFNQYGISVPTKTGNAVLRNKIKRQLKNIIDSYEKDIKKSFNYVIIIKKDLLNLTFYEKKEELYNLIGEK